MIIYVVTSGSYSDYRIEVVFLNKDKAEAYKAHEDELHNWSDYCTVEEYETADESAFPLPEIKEYYSAGVYIRTESEKDGIKTYKFEKIIENTHKTEQLPNIPEEFDVINWDEFIKGEIELISQNLPYKQQYTSLSARSSRSQEVATKVLQDKIARTIQILEDLGFVPAKKEE